MVSKANPKIRCIIFDLAGVVLNDIVDKYYDHLSKELKTERKQIEDFANPRLAKMELGELKLGIFLRSAARRFNTTQKSLLWRESVRMWVRPQNDVIRLIKRLKKRHTIALLSNIDRSDYFMDLQLIDKNLFDRRFLSFYLHVRKPDKRIYEIALSKLRLNQSETVFIDDRPKNVEAARQLGMHAIRFTSHQSLLRDLKELEIS